MSLAISPISDNFEISKNIDFQKSEPVSTMKNTPYGKELSIPMEMV